MESPENKKNKENKENKENIAQPDSKVEKFKQKLQKAIKQEDWPLALKLFDQMIHVRPTPQRCCNRSYILLQLGKLGAALESYDKAIELDPNFEVARKGIKKVEVMLQELKSENKSIEDTIVDTDKDEKIKTSDFQDAIKAKKWNKALEILNENIQQKPTAQRFCNQGFLFTQVGELEKAYHSYRVALELDESLESAQKGIKRSLKMIKNIQQGTKEEPMLSFQVEPQSFFSPTQLICIALVIFAILLLIFWP